MTMLHIVNKSPFEKNSLTSCLRVALPGSSVLLIEDAVVGATHATSVADTLTSAMQSVKLYAMGPDLAARGIDTGKLLEGVNVVDYAGFVDLVAEHDNNQSWV